VIAAQKNRDEHDLLEGERLKRFAKNNECHQRRSELATDGAMEENSKTIEILSGQLQDAFVIRNQMKSVSEGCKQKVCHYGMVGNFDSLGTVVRSLNFEAEDQITDSSLQGILRAALQGYQKSTGSMKKVARKRKYVT
jgi:hypothetical protein